MQNLLLKFRAFMADRYGFDQFGRFLFGLSVVFWLLSAVLRRTPLYKAYLVFWLLNTVIYVFALYRIFSRDACRRAMENERYLRLRGRVLPFFLQKKQAYAQRYGDPDYFFKNCPFCGAKLRLRRIKGKHTSRCPKCGRKFTVRVWRGKQ